MALRFALLRNCPPDGILPIRARSQFEVFYLDFDTEGELARYLRRPEVVVFAETVLSPLRDIALMIRDRFRDASPAPRDSVWLRTQLSHYIQLLVRFRSRPFSAH